VAVGAATEGVAFGVDVGVAVPETPGRLKAQAEAKIVMQIIAIACRKSLARSSFAVCIGAALLSIRLGR